ncbi:MAG: AraC family transcriptional regulator [Pseudomonadota bacterium]
MTFHPRMESMTEGLSVVGDLKLRIFDGAIADLWDVSCSPLAHGEYVSHAPRLVVVLGQTGTGGMEVTASPFQQELKNAPSNRLFYIPAGFKVWSRIENLESLRHLDVHFDIRSLSEKIADDFEPGLIETPKLSFNDDRVLSLASLIAGECETPGTLHDLYGDSLICALFTALTRIKPKTTRYKGQLAAHQLRKAIEFIEDNHASNIRLEELASLTGLSPAYFCTAFKLTTGMPPHRWQMRARVNRAKHYLENTGLTLSSIAVAAGFSDQAHFTRVFRQFTGTTPNAWRKSRLC